MRRKLLAAVIALLAVAGGGLAAYASIPDAGGVIHACRDDKNGALSVIDSAATCPKGATALNWNQVGPQGPPGAQGPAGPAGNSGYAEVTRSFHLDPSSGGDVYVGPISCPAGKRALNAGLTSLTPDPAWLAGFQSDPSRVGRNGSADVILVQVNPQASDYRSPVPATSGRTADGTGWVLHLGVNYPVWDRTAYGMTVDLWLACVLVG